VFYGLGSDGTVGANKNSIKIIGEETDNYAQGYFVYDSKKSGAVTVSHLRFGPRPIRSTYLIEQANFVACHQFASSRSTTCWPAAAGATFPAQQPVAAGRGLGHAAAEVQQQIIDKKLKALRDRRLRVARETGMGARINTIMQTCFFAISGVLPRDEAIAAIKDAIKKTYGKRGEEVVRRTSRRSTPRSRPARGHGAGPVTSTTRAAADRAREAPEFRQPVTARSWPARATCPVSACPSTAPSPPAPPSGRSATSPWRSRSGTRTCASSAASARWSAPRGDPHEGLRPDADLEDAPEGLQVAGRFAARTSRASS
jgi:pyruvate-ferredoxin/flavodoxin oxidoreductase